MIQNIVVILVIATIAVAQYDGPRPQRINVPGAVPVRQFRNEKDAPPSGPGFIRIRRPPLGRPINLNSIQATPQPTPLPLQRSLPEIEAKPVTEEPEDEFIPQISQQQQPQFDNEQNFLSQETLFEQQLNNVPRFTNQERPLAIPQQQSPQRPNIIAQDKEFNIGATQRFAPIVQEKQQVQQKTVISRPRPVAQHREPRPQFEQEQDQQPARHAQENIRSRPTSSQYQEPKERKPVAQIIRKYTEENEDGTITWGFENDDGSFKEEVIGIDCITRGRYGYIDPDGVKREYNYETGILCDPNNRGQNEDQVGEIAGGGYIDYQENKMVLPNGEQIDIGNIGKNKLRRPAGQQQQSHYRN